MVVSVKVPTQIVKRSGETVEFDQNKILTALKRCFVTVHKFEEGANIPDEIWNRLEDYTRRVVNILSVKYDIPTVEQVQDAVVFVLQSDGAYAEAEHYIIYRHERAKLREANYVPPEIVEAFERDKQYFPTELQRFQFYDKYSRFNYDLGRRETWEETVTRVVDFFEYLLNKTKAGNDPKGVQNTKSRIRKGILNLEVVPSMRLMAMAGEAAKRDNATIYNCSYLPIDNIESFCELMSNSMAGCGVGFSVESHNVARLPEVGERIDTAPVYHLIEDSAEGWVDALRQGLYRWFQGFEIEYDFSVIRPAGTPLKIKGGRASGKEPLEKMLSQIRSRIIARRGKRLTTLDCHDIACTIGTAVVSGGVRRTALISLYDADDPLMMTCKSGDFAQENSQRWNANNSAVWTNVEEMTQIDFLRHMWAMFESERGEPGIFSRDNAIRTMPIRRSRDQDYIKFGTNPCFHPDTIIETVNGPRKIRDITEPTYVYSMDENQKLVIRKASASWLTRKNASTVKIALSNGKDLIVTPEHKIFIVNKGWIEAGSLRGGDRVVGLNRNRRGAAYAGVKLTTQNREEYVMEHRLIWEGVNGYIPYGYDVHHKDNDTYNNTIDNFELLEHGVHSRLTKLTRPNNHQVKDEITGRFVTTTLEPGKKTIVDMPKHLKTNWHQYATVVYVGNGPTTDVYDISVEDTHNVVANGIIAHNCGEIILRPYQFCNLSAVVARADDTIETLAAKVELATIIGTIQSSATFFPNLRDIWRKNCEEERLLGVDITGQLDCPVLRNGAEDIFPELQLLAIETNAKVAEKLGINPSAAITCVKPSGNSSVLLDCSSGLHARWAPYYIRNVRVSASSPLVAVLRDSGYTLNPENGEDVNNPKTWVVSFPIKAPENAIVRDKWSALEQCNWWLINKVYWTEHNPSVTIYYKKDEILPLIDWLWVHRKDIGGMSFLPKFEAKYDQLPYIEIDEAKYNEMKAAIQPIQAHRLYLYEKSDYSTASQEAACEGTICELPIPS